LPKATGADAEAMERFRARVAAARPAGSAAAAPAAQAPSVDLTKLNIPILAVNGSFDNPNRKTHRLWREAQTFQNVILPGKTHLTAIAAGASSSQQYIDAIARFIDMFDR
jgi:pimeloyl-ACP methyl ester carboxylesterase